MNTSILKILLKKEFLLLRRNPFIPKVMIMLPVMVMLVIPLVANLDIRHANVAVVDYDHSMLSRRIASDINGTDILRISDYCNTHSEAMRKIEEGKADVIMTIPADYSRDIEIGKMPKIQVQSNGVNATIGMLAGQYVAQSVVLSLKSHAAATGSLTQSLQPTQIAILECYNPTMNFRNFMIPGLMVMLILIICGFLPALNIVDEKETGTIEAMNVTPIGKFTFVLSKLIPFWLIGMLVITVGIIIGWLVYGLKPAGNIWEIYFVSILFTLVMSGLGITIANGSSTMLQSVFVMFAVIMIFQLMSGLFTPVSSMPEWAQYIAAILPPRYYIEIMRGIYLKGAGISDMLPQFCILTAFAVIFCLLAAFTYRKRS